MFAGLPIDGTSTASHSGRERLATFNTATATGLCGDASNDAAAFSVRVV
jgi:hypothetical protein